jgi:signal peptide peptidase SppA
MKLPYFLAYCLRTPWAMDPSAMATYAAILARAYGAKALGPAAADHRDDTQYDANGQPMPKAARGDQQRAGGGNIAVIPVFGPIVQRASQLGMCEAGTGAEEIGAALDAALADSSVSDILMRFDTPGGAVFGIQELGDKIRAARSQKPVVGIADSMAASAGYWLLSQCSESYLTPGGMVGSIGVYTAHQSIADALKNEGVAITLISAGKYKTEGNPFEPLGDEARAETQAMVDTYYRAFTSAVAKGRGVPVDQVRSDMGEGRMLLAEAAVKAGMVDGIRTFADVIAGMRKKGRANSARASALAQAQADIAALS